jgi:hypothetical protein
MMELSLSGVVVAAVGFAIAFGIARAIAAVLRRRREAGDEAAARASSSRQVRRAQARKNKR